MNLSFRNLNCLIGLSFFCVLVSCSSSKEGDVSEPTDDLSVDKSLVLIQDASSSTFTITCSGSWRIGIPSTAAWLTVSPTAGVGDATVTCTAAVANYRERISSNLSVISITGTTKYLTVRDSLKNTAPAAPAAAIYPADGQADLNDTFLRLQWEPSVDAEGDKVYYDLDYSADGSTWKSLVTKTDLTSFSSTEISLLPNTKYYWRVTAYDLFGAKSAVSKIFSFSVAASRSSWKDGEARVFQPCCNSSATDPFTLIVTGDGFVASDFAAGGIWEQISTRAILALNNIEPYKTWGKYLRIIRLASYSAESGVSVHQEGAANNTASTVVNTKYGSMYDNVSSSTYCGLYDDVSAQTGGSAGRTFDLVLSQLTADGYNITKNYAVLVIQNVAHYNGTVSYYIDSQRTLGFVCISNGSIGSQTGFENVVCHEIGGHAIGHLADLYVSSSGTLSSAKVTDTQSKQKIGWYQNVSLDNSELTCPWAFFFTAKEYDKYYSNVGLYAGARSVANGIWRPESSATCMNDNRFYYDAPSRYSIVINLTNCAGEKITWNQFVAKDYDRQNSNFSSSRAPFKTENVPPLHEPITYNDK